jgi:hypothetical protein
VIAFWLVLGKAGFWPGVLAGDLASKAGSVKVLSDLED